MISKGIVRKQYLEKRKLFSENEIQELSHQIYLNFISSKFFEFNHFHIFLPIIEKNEVNTFPIIQFLLDHKKQVSVPKIDNDFIKSYDFTTQTILVKNKWNILEPINAKIIDNQSIDVVIIPLIICDLAGNRIGYGKGFYDKFLPTCNPNSIKIGVNFFAPIDELIEKQDFDIPLDYLVTPTCIVSFSPKEVK